MASEPEDTNDTACMMASWRHTELQGIPNIPGLGRWQGPSEFVKKTELCSELFRISNTSPATLHARTPESIG